MLLAQAINPGFRSAAMSPLDDRWYQPFMGMQSDTGITVSAETIFMCDVVKAAVQFKADAAALCPPKTFRRNGADRIAEPEHYSQVTLRAPNSWQTTYEWTHLNVVWMSLYGNSYNRIIPGMRSFADELRPIHPGRVRSLKQRTDGGMRYEVRKEGTLSDYEWLEQEEILHYRGISMDGFRGMEIYQLIRNIVGISLAFEKHAAQFLKRGARISGVLSPKGTMTQTQYNNALSTFNEKFGGVGGSEAGGVAMMGMEFGFTPTQIDHEKGQFIQLDDKYVEKILRELGVPGIVVGYTGDKASTYASAKEFWQSGGIKHCLLPILVNMEQRDDKSLLLDDTSRFIKRDLATLERANTQEMWELMVKAAGRPLLSGNDALAILDRNRVEGNNMDDVLMPAQMMTGASDQSLFAETAKPSAPPAPPPDEDEPTRGQLARRAIMAEARSRSIAGAAALGLVRREARDISAKAPKYSKNPAGWVAWVPDYYATHAPRVAAEMDIPQAMADAYCDEQSKAVLAGGVGVMADWEATVPPRLVALALADSAVEAA